MKKFIEILFVATLIFSLMAVTVSANSGPSSWLGADSTGAIITTPDCPLVVDRETLTFDIFALPQDYYYGTAELADYNSSFTAHYTFRNPENYDITATLAFPIGTMPDYLGYDSRNYIFENSHNGIKVNDGEIASEIRYTYFPYGSEFDYTAELPKLTESFMEDEFFYPEMPVTKYVITASGVDQDAYPAADIGFVWDPATNPGIKIYFENISSYQWDSEGKAKISAGYEENEEIALYSIGGKLENMPQWQIYENGSDTAKTIDGNINIVSSQETTLLQLLKEKFALCTNAPAMSEVDMYNFYIVDMVKSKDYYTSLEIVDINNYNFNYIMCWYVYDITVPAGRFVTNTVSAPLFPAINMYMEPDTFDYTYLLSPAQSWADFGPVEININTPFYMLENSIQGFEKTETGYTYTSPTLPDTELEFTLCSSETPAKEKQTSIYNGIVWSLVIVTALISVIGYDFINRKAIR